MKHDSELGWVALPNLHIENMYGDGISLRTNAQGIRRASEVQKNIPKGKVRILCSGDSFTFGYGVDNDHTWCNLLATHNERLETVNIGQNGYGVDQSFLLYRRVQSELDHQVHLFALITDDFRRAALDRFLGYPKPRVAVRNGDLIVENVPVPKRLFNSPHLIVTAETLSELRLVDLMRAIADKNRDSRSGQEESDVGVARTGETVVKLFQDLQDVNESNGSQMVLIYLPSGEWDYQSRNPGTEAWRAFVESAAREHGWLFLDLVADFNQLDEHVIGDLFDGHYSVAGNQFVADRLYDRLMSVPKFAEMLVP